MSAYGLGRLPARDPRDLLYPMRSLVSAPPPVTFRYYRTGAVLDQGQTPRCVGYAWRQWLSSALLMTKTGPDADAIYHGAQQNDEWPGEDYDGSSVRGGAKFLSNLGHIRTYVWAAHVGDMIAFLLGGKGTIVLGTNWYDGMFQPDKNAVVSIGGAVAGGHAYLCIGYSAPRGVFRFINSWGPTFGDRGTFWMTGETVERLLTEDGEAVAASEKRVKV
jgi:hypothetical protein